MRHLTAELAESEKDSDVIASVNATLVAVSRYSGALAGSSTSKVRSWPWVTLPRIRVVSPLLSRTVTLARGAS